MNAWLNGTLIDVQNGNVMDAITGRQQLHQWQMFAGQPTESLPSLFITPLPTSRCITCTNAAETGAIRAL